ncbi:MAG: tetratricopeptide repeat protein [Candidatus Omnitrophota bacterium]|nr:tetratricopeptide repeat protein [Candidatus Omnitrophota bacterium]
MSVHKKALIVFFLSILVSLNIIFLFKFSRVPSSKIKDVKPDRENLIKENLEFKNKYATLQKEYDAIIADRDNVLVQTRFLLSQKEKVKEAEAWLEEMKKKGEALEKEKIESESKNLKLQEKIADSENKIEELISEKGRAVNEKKQLEELIARERDKNPILKLEDEKAKLREELVLVNAGSKQVKLDLKQSQAQVSKLNGEILKSKQELSASKEQAEESRHKVESLNRDYAQALNKNRILEEKVVQTPKKFAEIARQNKALIKQASNMHYNLGVFYTKNKEYSRAIAEFEEAVKLRPDDAYCHFNLGYIYAEYLVNRPKAIEHFRHYLRVARKEDKDMDWVKKYIITWQAWGGKEPME